MLFKESDRVLLTEKGYNLLKGYIADMIPEDTVGYIHLVGGYGNPMNYIPPGWYHVIFRLPVSGGLDVKAEHNYSVRSFTISGEHLISADMPDFIPMEVPGSLPGQSQEIQQVYIATIQVVIAPKNGHAPEDVISAVLSENINNASEILDWQYAKVGGQFMKPTTTYVSKNYHEGDAFQ